VREEYARIWALLGGRAVEDLVDAPPMTDPECRATLDVLTHVQSPALLIVITQIRLIRTLRGLSPDFSSFDDADFDEGQFEQRLVGNPRLAIATCWYWIRKMQARFHADDLDAALAAAEEAQPLLWTSGSFFETAEYHFYGALVRAAHCGAADAGARRRHMEALAAHKAKIDAWAESCPDDFGNRAALVAAEIARIEGRDLDAERLYEQAIRSARDSGFPNHEAIAYEAAARFYRGRGFERFADTYLREARACYARWGADGKVRQIDRRHPELVARGAVAPTANFAASAAQLELLSVLKASQSISGEIHLPSLEQTLIRIVIEAAGAQKGYLLRSRGDDLFLEIEAAIEDGGEGVRVLGADVALPLAPLPASILNYVKRAREIVLLDDAASEPRFAADPYIAERRPRSVLCVPLVRQRGAGELESLDAASALLDDEGRARLMAALQAHIEHQVPLDVELSIRTKRGERLWCCVRGQAVWDGATGKATRVVRRPRVRLEDAPEIAVAGHGVLAPHQHQGRPGERRREVVDREAEGDLPAEVLLQEGRVRRAQAGEDLVPEPTCQGATRQRGTCQGATCQGATCQRGACTGAYRFAAPDKAPGRAARPRHARGRAWRRPCQGR
jgi:hypothetical protein